MTLIAKFIVYGMPAPKGSKSFKGMSKKGHAILVESSAKVPIWREAVKQAVMMEGHPKILGPVRTRIVFTLPKPKSAPKTRTTHPDRKPDLDKLVRATWDALKDMLVFEDDARVIDSSEGKRFVGEGPDALQSPGAVITIEAVA